MQCTRPLFLCALVVFLSSFAFAETGQINPRNSQISDEAVQVPLRPFPSLYFTQHLRYLERQRQGAAFVVPDEGAAREQALLDSYKSSLFFNNDILAFYGKPASPRMGILGLWPKEGIKALLDEWAQAYEEVNGGKKVLKAFYIIYGTVWPEGEIGILNDGIVKDYVEYALKNDMLVYLDHQIGKYTVQEAMEKLLPWLRYENVHLALDPEWRTLQPMKETGFVQAEELNRAQQIMQDYMLEHKIPGERQLVVHQFKPQMIRNRAKIRSNFPLVRIVQCMDGFGSPALKRLTYRINNEGRHIPVQSFKLFFKSQFPAAGYDSPLMDPQDVMALDPRPGLIIYQ